MTQAVFTFCPRQEDIFGDTAVYAGNPLNHIQGPSIKLFVADIDINHQVFVGFAEPNHGSGGYHVENHFLSGTRFHSRGAVNGLRTDERIDKDVGIGFEFCLRIGGDGNGFGAAAPGFCKHGHDIGGIAAGRNADNNVAGAGIESFKVFDGQFGIVFRAVDRSADTFVAAGDETLNQVFVDAESLRTVGSVKYGDFAAGAGSEVAKPAAAAESFGSKVYGTGDIGQNLAYGCRNFVSSRFMLRAILRESIKSMSTVSGLRFSAIAFSDNLNDLPQVVNFAVRLAALVFAFGVINDAKAFRLSCA